jgi:DNA-binding NarL/FixJ family response regulator
MGTTIRILLIDDHALVRAGLRRIIEDEPGFSVVGEAGSAEEGVRLAMERRPDLTILDLSLPDQSGLELLPRLRQALPRRPVLVVSMHRRTDDIVGAFQAGASGYVTKEAAADNLIAGIRDVLAGEAYIDPTVSQSVLSRLLRGEGRQAPDAADKAGLTPREQEVMRLIAEGLSTKAIAGRLGVSSKTVDSHRANIMRKLALDTTVDIVRWAVRLGLIDVSDWTA